MGSAELKKVLHDLCRAVEPYYIAYQLAEARRGRDSTSAGENPHPSTPIVESHQDHQSGSSPRGAGSLEAPETKEKAKK